MHFFSTATVALAVLVAEVAGRQITVVNNCAYTVWCVLDVLIASFRQAPKLTCPPHPGPVCTLTRRAPPSPRKPRGKAYSLNYTDDIPLIHYRSSPTAGSRTRTRRSPSPSPTTGSPVASGAAPAATLARALRVRTSVSLAAATAVSSVMRSLARYVPDPARDTSGPPGASCKLVR